MSSEPKAVGYVNGDGLNELKAGKAAGITVGIYSETLPRTTPLYDEQALSALRAEVEALRLDAERYRWLKRRDIGIGHMGHGEYELYAWTDLALSNSDHDTVIDAAMEQSA